MGANADDASSICEIRKYETSSVMLKIKPNAFNLGPARIIRAVAER